MVGRIYAVSTAGAILGVFITGFVLIERLGSRETVLYVAILTLVVALLAGRLWKIPLKLVAALVLVAGIGGFAFTQHPLETSCTTESNYFCIRVSLKELDDGSEVRVLALDRLVHSYAKPPEPTYLHYGYQHVFATVVEAYTEDRPDFNSLFIGGGGYELPRYLDAVYPDALVEVIEIDPAVTVTAKDYLGLARAPEIITYNEDARMALPRLPDNYYDVVVGDAFNDLSVPYHLTTHEFNQEVKRVLRDDGVYTINLVDAPDPGRFLRAFMHTLRSSFNYVGVVPVAVDLTFDDRTTSVIVASDRPIQQSDLDAAHERLEHVAVQGYLVSPGELETWMNSRETVLLTDNYAPVDNYLAPLYLKQSKDQ